MGASNPNMARTPFGHSFEKKLHFGLVGGPGIGRLINNQTVPMILLPRYSLTYMYMYINLHVKYESNPIRTSGLITTMIKVSAYAADTAALNTD